MDEQDIYDFINELAEYGVDLDDLGLDEEDLEEMDVDDLNTILENVANEYDEDEDEDEED